MYFSVTSPRGNIIYRLLELFLELQVQKAVMVMLLPPQQPYNLTPQ